VSWELGVASWELGVGSLEHSESGRLRLMQAPDEGGVRPFEDGPGGRFGVGKCRVCVPQWETEMCDFFENGRLGSAVFTTMIPLD
jgi:hypothetical protein